MTATPVMMKVNDHAASVIIAGTPSKPRFSLGHSRSHSRGKTTRSPSPNSCLIRMASPKPWREPEPIVRRPSSCSSSSSNLHTSDARPPPVPASTKALGFEKALRWDYDFLKNKWQSSIMMVRLDAAPFQQGSLRLAHHMVDEHGSRFVAKCRIRPPATNKEYFEDVAMQAACQHYALAYNRRGPPKPVAFIPTFVIQLKEREGRHFMTCEEYLPGVYAKYNNNGGWRSDDDRNTPQAFSHFTFVYSQRKLIIVDIQGVGDRYTDPQLHSIKQRYGPGDLGVTGMQLFFNTHKCSSICKGLGLTNHATNLDGTQMG